MKNFKRILLCSVILGCFFSVNTGIVQCEEVDKGKIPEKFLDKSVKELPSGIKIWDEQEAMAALNDSEAKVLWVDTRPNLFFKAGTLKKAVLLVYHKNEQLLDTDKGATSFLTKESLAEAMEKEGAEKVAYFCQGPKCHRSYNAALHSVSTWNLSADQVIWFRAGYPNLLKYIQSDQKLKRKMNKYFQGAVVN
ncbi:MAG: hypothetical protein DRP78_06940 [Candidatus Omnitrophota bacterium]|nr:MAG: hypothetical protein DRP78_06940 [Candidatus Omnitrophota bacterium]